MSDDGIHAFASDRTPASTPPAQAPRRSLGPWVLLGSFVPWLALRRRPRAAATMQE